MHEITPQVSTVSHMMTKLAKNIVYDSQKTNQNKNVRCAILVSHTILVMHYTKSSMIFEDLINHKSFTNKSFVQCAISISVEQYTYQLCSHTTILTSDTA